MLKCDRCKKNSSAIIMSMFNTQMICMDCKKEEKMRPDYEQARQAELEEVKRGNYNFPGIGMNKTS